MSAEPTEVRDQLEVPIDRMGAELLKALVDEVRTASAQWSKLTEVQQEMLISRLRNTVRTETEKAMYLIAKGARETARVKIESLTVKEGAKCVLQIGGDAAHDVLDYVGQSAVLVMCDPKQFFGDMDEVKADKQQPELPLGESQNEPPTALVLSEHVEVGDQVRFLSASPDGLVRSVRAVHRDVDHPPTIEVTGLPDAFAISLFEFVGSDPIGEIEAEDAVEPADDEETEDAAALSAAVAADEVSSASAASGKKRRRSRSSANGAEAEGA
jgi:hypothetical protein